MARVRKRNETKRISVTVNVKVYDYLEDLAVLGLHGSSAAEVARRFIETELERMVREGFITLRATGTRDA